jgi:hypothetical protein
MEVLMEEEGFESALGNDGIVQHVLSFVGVGSYAFVCLNKQWLAAYDRAGLRKATYNSRAFESQACLRVAAAAGLNFASRAVSKRAGRCADRAMLELAHSLGLTWNNYVTEGASNDCAKLEWLYLGQHCSMDVTAVTLGAVRANNVEVLQWLKDLGESFESDHFSKAALAGSMEVTQTRYTAQHVFVRISRLQLKRKCRCRENAAVC